MNVAVVELFVIPNVWLDFGEVSHPETSDCNSGLRDVCACGTVSASDVFAYSKSDEGSSRCPFMLSPNLLINIVSCPLLTFL